MNKKRIQPKIEFLIDQHLIISVQFSWQHRWAIKPEQRLDCLDGRGEHHVLTEESNKVFTLKVNAVSGNFQLCGTKSSSTKSTIKLSLLSTKTTIKLSWLSTKTTIKLSLLSTKTTIKLSLLSTKYCTCLHFSLNGSAPEF